MIRRLFQRFQQRVKRPCREHVNLIDNVNLIARRCRSIANPIKELAHILNACTRRRIHFQHIHMAAGHDQFAVISERIQINTRSAHSLGLIIQCGGFKRIFQRRDHRVLPDHILKGRGAVFTG